MRGVRDAPQGIANEDKWQTMVALNLTATIDSTFLVRAPLPCRRSHSAGR